MCSVFLLFWLSYQYLPSDWLERLLWGSLIVTRGSSPESPGRRVHMIFFFLLYCFIVLLCICVVSCPYMIYFPTFMARYSLFVLKVPLNPSKQTNKTKANLLRPRPKLRPKFWPWGLNITVNLLHITRFWLIFVTVNIQKYPPLTEMQAWRCLCHWSLGSSVYIQYVPI